MKLDDRKTATSFHVMPALAMALSICMAFTQTACAESDAPEVTAVPEATATPKKANTTQDVATDKAASSAENAAPEEPTAPEFSAGMQIPVDGTSLESFEASLAEIKGKATEDEYISLDGAIKYLMVYDLSAKRDKTKLAANLNGLTGEEIVNRVGWNARSPSGKEKSKVQPEPEGGTVVEPVAEPSEQ